MQNNKKPDYTSWDVLAARAPIQVKVPREMSEAIFEYRASTLKLLFYLGAQAPRFEGQRMIVRLDTREVKRVCGINGEQSYKPLRKGGKARVVTENAQIESVAEELRTKPMQLNVPREDGSIDTYHAGAISWWMINEEHSEMDFAIDSVMLPLWQRLRDYVKMQWTFLADFTSSYAIRIYLLLAEWKPNDKGRWTRPFTVAWLREHLAIPVDEYKNGHDFKRWVIEAAETQINSFSDISVRWEVTKTGPRRVIREYTFFCEVKGKAKGSKKILSATTQEQIDEWKQLSEQTKTYAATHPDDELVVKLREESAIILKARLALDATQKLHMDPSVIEASAIDEAIEIHRAEIVELLSSRK